MEDILTKLRALRDRVGAAGRGRSPDAPLTAYLDKVGRRAHAITDEEVQALLAAGHSEDEIFEATLSVAMSTAIAQTEAGLAALEGAQ
jgi:alkylhydroperoxidase family enzyme